MIATCRGGCQCGDGRGRADASKTHETYRILPRRRGDLEREFEYNVAEFIIPEYRNSKFRNVFLELYHEKEGLKKTCPDLA
jgi:hypothetical protein